MQQTFQSVCWWMHQIIRSVGQLDFCIFRCLQWSDLTISIYGVFSWLSDKYQVKLKDHCGSQLFFTRRYSLFALGIPYNLPKLCPNASWNASAVTFATNTWVGINPWAVFVNTNNTVFAANRESGIVRVFLEGSTAPVRNLSGNLSTPYSLFVSDSNDIYVDNGEVNQRVDKWSTGATSAVSAMYVCAGCYGLFIDINNNLYCSLTAYHQVASKSLDDRLNIWSVVAGNGTNASTSLTLNYPYGITVDKNLNLYVADHDNDRIQRFRYRELNGTTVVGTTAPGTISLYHPKALVLDADGYLFISDSYNHRIIGSSASGYRCIAACSGFGSSSSALIYPTAISFDAYGNLYVVDWGNSRIQKFLLARNSCGKGLAN